MFFLQIIFLNIMSILIKICDFDLNWMNWPVLGEDNGSAYRQATFVPESHRWRVFPGPITPHGQHGGHKSVGTTQAAAAQRFRTRRLPREGGGGAGAAETTTKRQRVNWELIW